MSTLPPDDLGAAAPSFMVRPYRPDGGFAIGGLMMLIGGLVLAGGVLGFAAFLVSQAIYLILVFPLFIGIAMGWIGSRLVRSGHVRNPWVGGLAGCVGGMVAMTVMHYMGYMQFQQEINAHDGAAELRAMEPRTRRALLVATADTPEDGALAADLFEIDSFPQYMHFQANQGVEISSSRSSSDRGINLGYAGSWIYWLIEMLIVAGITYAMVRTATTRPYCNQCAQWKTDKLLGSVAGGDIVATRMAINAGDLTMLAANKPVPEVGPLVVTAAHCPTCGDAGEVDVRLEHVTYKDNKESRTVLTHMTYPGDALAAMAALFVEPAVIPPDAAPPAGETAPA